MDWPCLTDTDTIRLAIADAALEADLVLDTDVTNALVLGAAGLQADPQFYPTARLSAGVTVQNVGSGSNVAFGSTRWALNGLAVVGNTLVTNVAGLWEFGGCISFNTGAAVGSVQAFVGPFAGVNNPANEQADSASAFGAFTPETITLCPVNSFELAAGAVISMSILHTFGGTIPTIALDGVMAEMWGVLVRPF